MLSSFKRKPEIPTHNAPLLPVEGSRRLADQSAKISLKDPCLVQKFSKDNLVASRFPSPLNKQTPKIGLACKLHCRHSIYQDTTNMPVSKKMKVSLHSTNNVWWGDAPPLAQRQYG